MSANEKYRDTSGAVPLILSTMIMAIPVVGFLMGNPDKEEFSEDVAANGSNLEKRVELVNKGYSTDTVCGLEADSIAENFIIEAGGKEPYIKVCVDETAQALVASGPAISTRG